MNNIKKRNCYSCKFLEYGYGDVGDPEGYVCTRKDFQGKQEDDMLSKMDNLSYLEKFKVCYRKKEENEENPNY